MVIWVTGLSGVGKTTLCKALIQSLKAHIPEIVLLDGDMIREVFGNELGYQEEHRHQQIKRIQRIAKLLAMQDITVIVAALYSHPALLGWNRENLPGYFEIYLEASLESLRQRDYKGLYAGAISGNIKQVVGMDIPWHTPQSPDLIMNMDQLEKPEILARQVISAVPLLTEETFR